MHLSPKLLALLGLILTNLFWASNAVIARYIAADIPPLTLAFLRWFIAFLILLPCVWSSLYKDWDKNSAIIQQRCWVIVVLGILGIAIFNTVLYLAAHTTTAVNITMVSSSLPLVTLLMSFIMLKTLPDRWQIIGITVSLLGVCIIISSGELSALLQMHFNQGDILILLIACAWSVYTVILRKYPVALNPMALITVIIAAGLPLLASLALLEVVLLPPSAAFAINIENSSLLMYIAVFPSILAYILWGYGVKALGPNIAALSSYLMPVFTVLLAMPLLGEQLYRYHILGGVMVLLGFYLASFYKINKRERDRRA